MDESEANSMAGHDAGIGRKLRVLFLMTRDPGHPGLTGGDMSIWENAGYLAREGHVVTVVTSGFPGAASWEMVEGVEVIRRGGIHWLWWRSFVYYMRHARGRYDVVVTEGFGGSRIPRFAPLYVKEPIITEWHQVHRDLFAAQYPSWLVPALNGLERLTAFVHRNTTLIARTEEWKQAFPQLGFKLEKIRVVPAGIDDSWLPRNSLSTVTNPQVVWIGKFRRYKSPDHIVRAMARVIPVVPRARLVLAGRHDDKAYERELQGLSKGLGIADNVEFRFDMSEVEKRALLRNSRVLVVPSSVEGFGIVVLEANACGVPVIASSGVPESVVSEERNGLRYGYGDIPRLAAAVMRILMEDALYRTLSTGGIAFAKRHTRRRVCAQYEEVISEVVGGQAHAHLASVSAQGE